MRQPSKSERVATPRCPFKHLSDSWRTKARELRTLEAHGQAAALELAAKELDAEIRRSESELLTIREAAAESGYSKEHLRRLAREGDLPVERNGGNKSKIKVRRGNLPTKRRRDGRDKPERVDYDPDEDARSIAKVIGGAA